MLLSFILTGCGENVPSATSPVLEGDWRFAMTLGQDVLPFTGKVQADDEDGLLTITIHNAEERITLKQLVHPGDSLIFDFPIYPSKLTLFIESKDLMTGFWYDLDRENYRIPVVAEYGQSFRFTPSKSSTKIARKYKVDFGNKENKKYPAILLIDNQQGSLTGTFLTETGDYRYLAGNIMNGKINLSAFDGSHAWLFEATIDGDSLKDGRFISGTHYSNTWVAAADSSFELKNPRNISKLKQGFTQFEFALPNQDGDTLTHNSFIDGRRVVIYDIMGSWCPNCKDGALALREISEKFDNKVLIVPITFERSPDLETAHKRVSKMRSDLNLPPDFVFGGIASSANTQKALPALDRLASYPTLIVTNKHGEVVEIYSGFYGPSTAMYYERFMSHTMALVDSLIQAK
jgi:thiol-disulfide isomerase/thioredoxin